MNVEHEMLKCMIILVINGTNGKVTTALKKNLEAIPIKRLVDSLQKAAKLGTSHIIRKGLQSETGSLSVEDRLWFKRRRTGEKRSVMRHDDDDNYNNNNNNNNNM